MPGGGLYGQRHDGVTTRKLAYEERPTKGPHTVWDAPGMQRIKIPYGGLTAIQLEMLSALAEEQAESVERIGIAGVARETSFEVGARVLVPVPAMMNLDEPAVGPLEVGETLEDPLQRLDRSFELACLDLSERLKVRTEGLCLQG